MASSFVLYAPLEQFIRAVGLLGGTHPRRKQLTILHANRRVPIAVAAAGTACATALVFAVAGPASSATSPGPGAAVPVAQGIDATALAGTRVLGDTAAGTAERVSFVLKDRQSKRLETEAETGMRGGYLSVAGFANAYGQPEPNVTLLREYLAKYGIKSQAYADRLDVSATGTAGQFDRALATAQKNYAVPAVPAAAGQRGIPAQRIHAASGTPRLPASIAKYVLCVLGLSSYSPYTSSAVHAPQASSGTTPRGAVTVNHTPQAFARGYGLDPLYAKGYTGAGQTIGIVTLASITPSAPYHFWRQLMHLKVPAGKLSVLNVDGGSGAPSLNAGSDETSLDVEQSGGLAPMAHVDLYQAPNTDPGFADAFYDAASRNVDESVSVSWGESESLIAQLVAAHAETPAYLQAFDQAFLELDAQGQSAFDAAGDSGAYDNFPASTNLTVDNPADSPYITSSGGTTLAGKVAVSNFSGKLLGYAHIHSQRAWGWDYTWPFWKGFGFKSEAAFATSPDGIGGGGGGFSVDEPTPLYQENTPGTHRFSAVKYLTPAGYKTVHGLTLPTKWKFNAKPPVTTGNQTGRAVPDVSANADPLTGYLIYCPQFQGSPLEDDWGGTSFIGPQFNGSTAIIDQYVGGRVGFWNPAIYQFANQAGSPFTPIGTSGTSSDNLYYTGTPGLTYNAGTGLGVPDMARLAADFATQANRGGASRH
jgi:kumamolisin